MSRVYLQQGAIAEARTALIGAGSYRADNPLEDEPSPHVGEARCQQCHGVIFNDSLASRHTQTFHRGAQLRRLPRPDRPLGDPGDPNVTHAITEVDGALWEETRVRDTVLRSLVEYAFGTSERYLTMVTRDARNQFRMARLSYYHTADGQGWDRTFLAVGDPTEPEDFVGETIGVRAGVASCVDCHTTYPRAGRERIGPEAADRAIGCERCHGPGGNHLAAVAADLADRAIVNPASASAALSRKSGAIRATSLTRATGRATAKNPAGSARKGRAGPGAGATPRAPARSAASPATTHTRASGRRRPHSTRPNASPATRRHRFSTPASQGPSPRPRPGRDQGSARSTRQRGASNATCPASGWTRRTGSSPTTISASRAPRRAAGWGNFKKRTLSSAQGLVARQEAHDRRDRRPARQDFRRRSMRQIYRLPSSAVSRARNCWSSSEAPG